MEDAATLVAVLERTPLVMALLHCVAELGLREGYLAAGVIRSAYWAHVHREPLVIHGDVDVVFFDAACERERDAELAAKLSAMRADVRWEVTNQAHVHRWYVEALGIEIAPFTCCAEGVATWPEQATCIGARLRGTHVEVLAPCGLGDLLALRWRANPACPDADAYARRLAQKRPHELWPLLTVGS